MQASDLLADRVARLKSLLEDQKLDIDTAFDTLVRESRAPGTEDTLARAALLRAFDRVAYESLLADAGSPPFEKFVALPGVEPVPGREGHYWVVPQDRARLIAGWSARTEAFVQLHRAAAEFYASPNRNDPLARLHHLTACDPKAALALFELEFAAADASFDLARCNALLDVLRGAKDRIGPELAQALARQQQRYLARSMFADSYYRTGTYFLRPRIYAEVEKVRADPQRWILHMHATGGMGKTMFLRWLVARELVPKGVPCARLDFDDVSVDAVRRHPWLVLLPICEQLNPQLPRPFLTEILESAPPYQALLQPGGSAGVPAEPAASTGTHDADGGKGLVTRMGHALLESGASEIFVILDTLEVVTVSPEVFAQIFALLDRLHDVVPGVRLVLAGRYHLGAKVRDIANELDKKASTFFLSRFTNDEASDFLRFRGLQDPTLIKAIVAKVSEQSEGGGRPGCNPFKLALLTDLVLGTEGADEDFVRSLPSADYQYLLERVIKRIREQPLRWVVRYGVIPRRLTFDYMEEILLPPLRRLMSGGTIEDAPRDPARLPSDLQSLAGQDIWVAEPGAEISAEALWDQLLRYESAQGWISHVPGTGAYRGSLQFHSDVAGPMRDLLSYQPIFAQLQDDSIGYFQRLATNERRPQRWVDWACEAVFHRVQRDPVDGQAYWAKALGLRDAREHAEVRLQLAQELLKPDYAEDERVPRERRGTKLVPEECLAEAHLVAAEATEALMRSDHAPADASWTSIRKHFDLAKQLSRHLPASEDFAARATLIEGALLNAEGKREQSVTLLRAARAREVDDQRRFVATWHLAEALSALSSADAQALYDEAIGLARRCMSDEDVTALTRRLANRHLDASRLLDARSALMTAFPDVAKRGQPEALVPMLLQLAEIELRLAEFGCALAALRHADRLLEALPADTLGAVNRPWRDVLWARLWSAISFVPEKFPETLGRSSRNVRAARGRALELHGRALVDAATLHLSAAARHWDDATRLVETEGGSALQAEFALHRARMLNRAGNFRAVLVLLEDALRVAESADDYILICNIVLERVLALAQVGETDAAQQAIQTVFDAVALTHKVKAALGARTYALALALGLSQPSDQMFEVLGEMIEVTYPTARALALEPLQFAPAHIDAPAGWLDRIDALLQVEESDEVAQLLRSLGSEEPASSLGLLRRSFGRVELHRVFGDASRAVALLDDLLAMGRPRLDGRLVEGSSVPLRLLIEEARARIGAFETSAPLPSGLAWEPAKSVVSAALLLARAEALFATGASDESVTTLLEHSEHALNGEPLRTRWHAKHVELCGRAAVDPDNAAHLLKTARVLFGELGDTTAQHHLDELLSAAKGGEAPPAAAAEAEPSQARDFRLFTLTWRDATSPLLGSDRAARLALLEPPTGQPVSDQLAEAITRGREGVSEDLGAVLFDPQDRAALGASATPLALRLKIEDPSLSALPWEFAVFPGEESGAAGRSQSIRAVSRVVEDSPGIGANSVQFVQRALARAAKAPVFADGLMGPQTRRAIESFQRERGLAANGSIDAALIGALAKESGPASQRGRILVVQPDVAPSDTEDVTYIARAGSALPDYYKRLGAHVLTLADASAAVLDGAFRDVTLIHLVMTVRATQGMVFLDFTRRRQSSAGEQLTPVLLDSLMKSFDRGRPRPFLILDIARPSSTFEAAIALGLRNVFASQLLKLRTFSAVLATGLEQPALLGTLAKTVISALDRDATMGSLAMDVRAQFTNPDARSRARNELDLALAYLGTALFADDPDLPCTMG